MLSFDEWVKAVFDQYNRHEPESESDPPAALMAEYMTRLFESPDSLIESYSENEIALGLEHLLFNANSNYVFVLVDSTIPLADRVRLVNSFFTLFERLFSAICSDYCGTAILSKRRPADVVCFMMWDAGALQIYPERPEQREVDQAYLNVLKRILALPPIPCQKSALHGLGHNYHNYPDEVAAIIDDFLEKRADIPPDLVEYAKKARIGGVL